MGKSQLGTVTKNLQVVLGSLHTALKTAYNWDWVAFAATVQALVNLLGPTHIMLAMVKRENMAASDD